MTKYKKKAVESKQSTNSALSLLDQLVLIGARKMIQDALEAEVNEYIGREKYQRAESDSRKLYRNGYSKQRNLTLSCGSIAIQAPRLREKHESNILGRYQRLSPMLRSLIPELYMHGLSTGDFQQCFQSILGDAAPLSDTSVLRMKQDWEEEYRQWKKRRLNSEYLYVWADGVYPKAGPKEDPMCVLVIAGLNNKGEKEILALEEGYRESSESWSVLLRDLKKRGVEWIGMFIADGALGLWKAQRDVFPGSKRQRCWVHKMRNIVDKVPVRVQDEILQALREIYHAPSLKEAQKLIHEFCSRYKKLYPKAVNCLWDDRDLLLTYFLFPKKHWRSIKTTNVIESMFSTVKLRTNAARRISRRDSALFLVFKLLTTLQIRLRKIRGYRIVKETIELHRSTSRAKLRMVA